MSRRLAVQACALLVLLALVPLAATARADGPADDAVSTDSMGGGWAATGCGIFVRATFATGGTQVGIIAGAVACCGYMLFDAFFLSPK
jgi:hypothetical protein